MSVKATPNENDLDKYKDVSGEMLPPRIQLLGDIQGEPSPDRNDNMNAKGKTKEASASDLYNHFKALFTGQLSTR